MDRFEKNPEPFLRRSSSLKPAIATEHFRNYRAKTGHNSRFGKAMLTARIQDLNTNVEIGQSEEDQSPLVVMSARADKRFSHDTKPNPIDMNRAYKRRFDGKSHYNDLNKESVLPDISEKDSSFKYKRHLKRVSKSSSESDEDFDKPMPFMDDEMNKEAIMNLNSRLMENRADATLHRGRDPTRDRDDSKEKQVLENERSYHSKIEHLKQSKQKMYFKQFERAWDALKKSGKKKGTIFPEGAEPDSEAKSTESTEQGMEGVNAYASGETQE